MAERSDALVVDKAVKRFGPVVALDGVGLTLGHRELLALVGPSGCGKSTLLRTIAGLSELDEGRVVLNGEVVDDGGRHRPPEHRRIGLVFQEHSLFPHLTVAGNVAFGIRDGGRRELDQRVGEALELVALAGYGDRYPHELSGGERQRVALARALAPRPSMVLLDEPFASLDPNLRVQLRSEVVAALRATDTPAIFVTHDQIEALAVGDRVAVMRSGRIEQIDRPGPLFHRPVNRFVAAFMGESAFLPVKRDGAEWSSELGPVTVDRSPADPVAMVRPDDLVFVPAPAGDDGPDELVGAEFRGAWWHYTIRLGTGSVVYAAGSHLEPQEVGSRGRVALVPGHSLIAVADEGR